MGTSNELDVVIAPTPVTATISTPTLDVASGSVVPISGTTNAPDGTTFTLNVNGTPDPNTAPTTSSGGAFSFNWTATNPSTTSSLTDKITVTF